MKNEDIQRPQEELELKIGYVFENKELLRTALTHSSYSNEVRGRETAVECNERLEFLGDSILSVIVSDYIYKNYRDFNEGDLTKIRAAVVCENSLAEVASELSLGSYIYLGHGEIVTHGRHRKSIISDATEAKLQRIVQQTPEEILEYVLVGEDGPAHDRVFTMEVRLNSNVLGKGTGHSKREAEQYAARMALEYFEDEDKA